MNNCSFIGRLGHDVELRYTADEKAVGRFSIAIDNGKDEEGNKLPPTWIECAAYGRQAETINRFFHKGDRIGIECYVKVRHGDPDENGRKPKYTNFVVKKFTFMDDKKPAETGMPAGFEKADDDIPF